MRERMVWSYREPSLEDLLSDSLVKAMMAADRVDPQELRAMLRRIAGTRTAVRPPAEAAPTT